MSTYGLAGTSPFRDWNTGPTKVIIDWFKSKYNETITEIPFSQIQYAEPWSGDAGDFGIYFQRIASYADHEDLVGNIENEDIYINIHLFARSGHEEYHNLSTGRKSAEYFIDRFERWIRRTIAENQDSLIPEGIIRIRAYEARDVPLDAALSSINPEKEFDFHEIEIKRRIMMIELKTQHILTSL